MVETAWSAGAGDCCEGSWPDDDAASADGWLGKGGRVGWASCPVGRAAVVVTLGGLPEAGSAPDCWAASKAASLSNISVTAKKRIAAEIVSHRGAVVASAELRNLSDRQIQDPADFIAVSNRSIVNRAEHLTPPCLFLFALSGCCSSGFYAVTYLPVSSTRLAIFSCSAITFTGSCFTRRRTIAICVRSMSPSATAATTFLAAASSLPNAPSR